MKDLVKINYFSDKKQALEEAKSLKSLVDSGLYPEYFTMPLTLQFELTSKCNVKCKHCYNSSGENNARQDRMTPERWKDFSHSLVKQGGGYFSLCNLWR